MLQVGTSRLHSISLHKPGDGSQDLILIIREPEDVIMELISDPIARGSQYFKYQEYKDDHVYRVNFNSVEQILANTRVKEAIFLKSILGFWILGVDSQEKTQPWSMK